MFSSFLKSFLVDVLLFSAALVRMIKTLVVIYMVCGQSKLEALVTNIALQHVKETETTDIQTGTVCVKQTGIS